MKEIIGMYTWWEEERKEVKYIQKHYVEQYAEEFNGRKRWTHRVLT